MVAYNFQRQFAPMIIAGTKRSTLRVNGKRRQARADEELQLYTGMRTRGCALLMRVPCASVIPIEIHLDCVIADGFRQVNTAYFATLAKNEGFTSFGNLQAWFDRQYGLPATNLTQIQWNPKRAIFRATSADLAGLAV